MVRARNKSEAEKRLLRLFKWYKLSFGRREQKKIKVICGDLKTLSGFQDSNYDVNEARRHVEEVYHIAALTDFKASEARLMEVNFLGTKEVITFIESCTREIHFHYVSSIFSVGKREEIFEDPPIQMPKFNNFYEKSKFLAEKVVYDKGKKGLKAIIYRPSVIMGDFSSGMCHNFGLLYFLFRILKNKSFSMLPVGKQTLINIIPSNLVAQAILTLGSCRGKKIPIYHIVNPTNYLLRKVIVLASKYLGISPPNFKEPKDIMGYNYTPTQLKMLDPFLPYFSTKLKIFSFQTQEILRMQGFCYPEISSDYIKRAIHFYFTHKKKNFLC